MKKTLILLAGYPATGKTYLRNKIISEIEDIVFISPDDIKVKLWKEKGFKNLDEKEEITQESWGIYYYNLEEYMKNETIILSEYPFSVKQRSNLDEMSKRYGFNIFTIRLVAEFEELYKRHEHRDLNVKRDLVYLVSSYDANNPPTTFEGNEDIVTKEEFRNRYDNRGYGTFELGKTLEVDTTDFSKVDYEYITESISNYINQ